MKLRTSKLDPSAQYLQSSQQELEDIKSYTRLNNTLEGEEELRINTNVYQQIFRKLAKFEGLQRFKKLNPQQFQTLKKELRQTQINIEELVQQHKVGALFDVVQIQRRVLFFDKDIIVPRKIEKLVMVRNRYEYQFYLKYLNGILTKEQLYKAIVILRTEQKDKRRQLQLRNFELSNLDTSIRDTEFDGYYFNCTIRDKLISGLKKSNYAYFQEETERMFDSGNDIEFTFNFTDQEEYWEEQTLQFKSSKRFFTTLGQREEELKWKELRGSRTKTTNTYIGTAVYLTILKIDHPATYEYLMKSNFGTHCHNVWDYITECKRFTTHLKFNYSALLERNIEPAYLFELEQLSGYRVKQGELSWKEQVEDWVKEKGSNSTPMASVVTKVVLNNQTNDIPIDVQFDYDVTFNAATYNSSGTAKGEKIDNALLRDQGVRIPKTVPASKTAYNLSITNQERRDLMDSREPLFGYLIDKEEVTKVRGVVNTDLKSHFKMAPLEKMMVKLLKGTTIFGFNSEFEQAVIEKEWLAKDEQKICMDQSSFDHYVSAHTLVAILKHYKEKCESNTKIFEIVKGLEEDFRLGRIAVVSDNNQTFWESGILSGWKITSIGGSTANKAQTAYCMAVHGIQERDYWITVLGDDVVMKAHDQITSKRLAFTMNANGLKQHPDKTITSNRFNEFLRKLYDQKRKTIQAYPTRLIPSLIYRKPWIGSYLLVENDYGGIVSRIKNWISLGFRIDSRKTIAIAAAADVTALTGVSSTTRYKDLITKFQGTNLYIKVSPEWTKLSKTEKIMERLPSKIDILNGKLRQYDIERWTYISSNERFFGSVDRISDYEVGELIPWYTYNLKKFNKSLPSLPFPRSWINKIRRQMKAAKFIKMSLTYGLPFWELSIKIQSELKKYLQFPSQVVEADKKKIQLKSELIYITGQPDSYTSILKKAVEEDVSKSIQKPINVLKNQLTLVMGKQDWNQFVLQFYGTDKIYV